MKSESIDIVIIGGGISGLTLAHWLKKSGRSVLVLEKDQYVGGTMKTIREDGFLVETGPNSALETTPLFQELVSDLGLNSEFLYANPAGKKRYVLRNEKLHPLPLSPQAFLATRLFSRRAKFRLLKEPFVGRALHEESIAEFVERRLGREFLDYAIDPFVAGVYAAKPETLSVRAAFPKLYALEERYGGLFKGMLGGRKERKKRAEKAKDRAETFSFRSGMQTLPLALAGSLGANVHCGAVVTEIREESGIHAPPGAEFRQPGFRIRYREEHQDKELQAFAVILSTPAHAAAQIVESLSSSASALLRSIEYPPVASVYLGYRKEDVPKPLDGFGFLVPAKEQREILGCLWSSSLFPERAPTDYVGLTSFVGGGRQPELVDLAESRIADLVMRELKSIMQIRGKPVYLRVTRWPKAIPQYVLGYGKTLETLENLEARHPGLFFCSNYRGGISVGDCVMSAASIADRIDQFLQQRSIEKRFIVHS